MPNTIGVIDCTHVHIQAPHERDWEYINRKERHSINIQLVGDADLIITNCVVKCPESVHDARGDRDLSRTDGQGGAAGGTRDQSRTGGQGGARDQSRTGGQGGARDQSRTSGQGGTRDQSRTGGQGGARDQSRTGRQGGARDQSRTGRQGGARDQSRTGGQGGAGRAGVDQGRAGVGQGGASRQGRRRPGRSQLAGQAAEEAEEKQAYHGAIARTGSMELKEHTSVALGDIKLDFDC
ncbi:putative nuclease HARBI1 [Tachysurus ichikawai]